MLCLISDNKIKYCNLANILNQTQNINNYFDNMNFNELFYDSEILSFNYNHIKGLDLLILTKKSILYYTNLEENISIKLFSFICLFIFILLNIYNSLLVLESTHIISLFEHPISNNIISLKLLCK